MQLEKVFPCLDKLTTQPFGPSPARHCFHAADLTCGQDGNACEDRDTHHRSSKVGGTEKHFGSELQRVISPSFLTLQSAPLVVYVLLLHEWPLNHFATTAAGWNLNAETGPILLITDPYATVCSRVVRTAQKVTRAQFCCLVPLGRRWRDKKDRVSA